MLVMHFSLRTTTVLIVAPAKLGHSSFEIDGITLEFAVFHVYAYFLCGGLLIKVAQVCVLS